MISISVCAGLSCESVSDIFWYVTYIIRNYVLNHELTKHWSQDARPRRCIGRCLSTTMRARIACEQDRLGIGQVMARDIGTMKNGRSRRSGDWLLASLTGRDACRIGCASPSLLRSWIELVDRQLRRERNKGRANHWSYSLDRHIALKAARDRLMRHLVRHGTARKQAEPRTTVSARG